MRIAIDGGGYAEACDGFYDANHDVVDAVSALASALADVGSMAGTDTGGEAWAAQYDPAARQAVQAGCDLGASLGTVANLLNASLVNHDAADGGAELAPVAGMSDGDDDPRHGSEELSTSAPASAAGGTGDQPSWWHWIAGHVEGLVWPDADTGQLRSAGAAWVKAGQAIDLSKGEVDAATSMVASQTSPEVKDAVAACDELSGHVSTLSSAYETIGAACRDYADQVDSHRDEVWDELKSFIEWTVGIEIAGGVVGFFTAGIGEGAAQGVEAAKIAQAAAKVISILKKLIEVAKSVAETIGNALKDIIEVAGKLPKFATALIDKLLVKLGNHKAEEAFPELTMNARQLQSKFKHAEAFGVEGNYNAQNAARFNQALRDFTSAPTTQTVRGTYRGDEAIISFDGTTSQVVVRHPDGSFWSCWKLNEQQLENVMGTGSLGGG